VICMKINNLLCIQLSGTKFLIHAHDQWRKLAKGGYTPKYNQEKQPLAAWWSKDEVQHLSMQQGRKYSPKSCLFAIYLNSWLQGSKLLFDTTSRRSIRFPEYQLCTETPTFRNIKSFSNAFADHRVKVLEVAAQALVAKCCPSNILLSIELVQKSPVFQKGALRLKSQYRGLRVLKQKNSRADWNRLTWFMPFECSYQSGYLAMRS
jgi:hypothetical protein